MAEVKNAFIKSKMNKDLDDRLLPSGEYRNAINAQISKSEGSDVGALENVLGNALVADFTDSIQNMKSIGYLSDEFTNNVYVFLTDNNSSIYVASGPGSNHLIYKYNVSSGVATKLVEGSFLNFSTLNPIFGVNLLEDLLFWTDNRNQPRKINVLDAASDINYYANEDQISVAKYYPYESIVLEKESTLVPTENESTMKDVVSMYLPNGGTASCSGVTNSNILPVSNLNVVHYPNIPQNGFTVGYIDSSGNVVMLGETVVSYSDPNITLSGPVTIPLINGSTEIVINVNPYYEKDYSGDDSFLEDKFVRFSYRFKFDDGEYSLLAPFTQVCFIPKQDGYFLNTSLDKGDQEQALESTIVDFMENKVNKIDLQIPLPCPIDDLKSSFHVTEIDIIYKESDGLALQVVESIEVENISGASTFYEYSYLSQKPYKTLPSSEITRVYDKVPVKALAQEIISNRVVYGNFLNKIDPPSFLDYQVAATGKTNVVEYPSSSLKTNRNYQVGVVLADKYGRQSTVVLSNNKTTITVNDINYSGSTIYSPYINESVNENTWLGNSLKLLFNSPITKNIYNDGSVDPTLYNPLGWYSYKIVVKQTEQDYYNVYTAGALQGDPSNNISNLSTSYISLINDNINKVPRDLSEVGPTQKQFRSSVRLFGRVENTAIEQSNTGNQQFFPGKKSFTVSTIQSLFDLFDYDELTPISDTDSINVIYNAKTNPLVGQITTSQESSYQFGVVNSTTPFSQIENLAVFETEPSVSKLDIYWETSTSGLISDLNDAINTENPSAGGFDSFDTSAFNEGIQFGEDILTTNFKLVDFFGTQIPIGDIESFNLTSVFTTESTAQNVTNYFTLYEPNGLGTKEYNIKVTSDFLQNVYYGSSIGERVWNFNFTSVVSGATSTISKNVYLGNLPPVIYVDPYTPAIDFTITSNPALTEITTLKATNGASVVDQENPNTSEELTWTIVSQTGANGGSGDYFGFNTSVAGGLSTFNLTNNSPGEIPSDTYTVVIRVTDAGGANDQVTLTINMGVVILPGQVLDTQIGFGIEEGGGVSTNYEYVTFIIVTESVDPLYNGLYMYPQPWAVLGGGGGNVTIDYTNAVNLQVVCPYPSSTFWAYSTDTSFSGRSDVAIDYITCYYQNVVGVNIDQEDFVDTTNNTFSII
jgi:hypothetical protein